MNSNSFTTSIINKFLEEFNKNENNINSKLIQPLLNKIYLKISYYLYFIFSILLIIVIMVIVNYITLVYYMSKLLRNSANSHLLKSAV